MVNVYDFKPEELIKKTASELKKLDNMKKPEWAIFVKTSVAKERQPVDNDWWYIRAASILRKLYILDKPIGTNKLRNFYSGRKNRGHKPDRVYKGAGKIIRVILQQLEKSEFLESIKEGKHIGRKISKKGKSFLDKMMKDG